MTPDKAKQKLFKELDQVFINNGADAGMCNPGFFPHYSEVNADTMRPTWYTKFKIDDDTTLITMYESVQDVCISTLIVNNKKNYKSIVHTGYPKNIDDTKKILELFKKL